MTGSSKHRPETLAARALGWVDPASGSVRPPLYSSTTHARRPDYQRIPPRRYARDHSPPHVQPPAPPHPREGGAGCALFASGIAAAATVFQALQPGDHAVVQDALYFGLPKWLRSWAEPWGLKLSFVPTGDVDAIGAAVRQGATRLVWIETPA